MTPTPQQPPRRPPTPRPSVAFNMAPKQAPKKQEKPEGFDEDLDRACKEFLKNNIPVSNIVFVEEFAKYLPLFNKEMHKTLDPKAKTQLTQEYFGRFSPQHNKNKQKNKAAIRTHIQAKSSCHPEAQRSFFRIPK